MKDTYFTTIYNIPEEISGVGCGAHFIGFCLLPALVICAIPCILIDDSWLKDTFELLASSSILIILAWFFILIICPIYFFIRSIMELIRYKRGKQEFYSKPNIEYIQLNNNEIFFKNTCPNNDFTIKKQDIIQVILDGEIKSVSNLKATRTPDVLTYVENLTLTIKTANKSYTIYPQIKLKQIPKRELFIDEIELLKQQIAFYKGYFDNIDILFDFGGTDTISKATSMVKAYELKNGVNKKSTNYFDITYKIILVAIFLYYIYEVFFVLK